MRPMIGILAGMGPKSTAPFVDLVVEECQRQYGAQNDMDFPPMMIYSLPTPFYIDRPIDHEAMKRTVAAGLRTLASTGVDFIAMPCNTAHAYFAELEKSIDIPLLNIIAETVVNLPQKHQNSTLFVTSSTYDTGLYQKAIEARGHTFVFREEWQDRINTIIRFVKDGDDHAITLWRELLDDVYGESVDHVVNGCTDLSVVSAQAAPRIPMIDSARCLAQAVVKKYVCMRNQ